MGRPSSERHLQARAHLAARVGLVVTVVVRDTAAVEVLPEAVAREEGRAPEARGLLHGEVAAGVLVVAPGDRRRAQPHLRVERALGREQRAIGGLLLAPRGLEQRKALVHRPQHRVEGERRGGRCRRRGLGLRAGDRRREREREGREWPAEPHEEPP
jgi:hypothetical protein